MKEFTIKAAERLSGIKAHTLRVWEQRYGILQPSRKKDSNHRVYTNSEMKALLKIVYLYHMGMKISEIAGLKKGEVERLIQQSHKGELSVEGHLVALKEAMIDFDEVAFERKLDEAVRKMGMKDALLTIVFPLLNQIGLLWLTDKVVPGQEHFASNIIIRKLIKAIDEVVINRVQRSGLILLFTPENEFHEIPLLFFRYLLMVNGYNTVYLGVSVPLDVVKIYLDKYKATHILVHFTSNLQAPEIPDILKQLQAISSGAKIVIAGPALHHYQIENKNISVLSNEDEMLVFCEKLSR
jgi:MerR family transcriptional regulator, light-induced transcriptional regulator